MNPFDPPNTHGITKRPIDRNPWPLMLLALVAGVVIAVSSAIDQHREGYGPTVSLALFAASPVVPVIFMLWAVRHCQPRVWRLLVVAGFLIISFGVVAHLLWAVEPEPRHYYRSKGQVHIFILPVFHWMLTIATGAIIGTSMWVLRFAGNAEPGG